MSKQLRRATHMRHSRLCAFTLVLSLYGTAAGQVGVLVEHDTSNDPCGAFKMRVLKPADVELTPRARSPFEALDRGIVWNPCREVVPQLAARPGAPVPDRGRGPVVPTFNFQLSPAKRGAGEDPTTLRPQPPPAFELMRPRP